MVGHAAQTLAEPLGGDACNGPAEGLAAATPPHRLPTNGSSIVKTEVLDRDPNTAVLSTHGEQAADRRPKAAVPRGRRTSQVEGNGDGFTNGVAVCVKNTGREVVGIQIDAKEPPTSRPDRLWWRQFGLLSGPGRIQIPPAAAGVVGDVVPDSAVGSKTVEPLTLPVVEGHLAGQPVSAAGRVGRLPQCSGSTIDTVPSDGSTVIV